jgi:hypothetical protein
MSQIPSKVGFSKEEPYPYVNPRYELLAYDPALSSIRPLKQLSKQIWSMRFAKQKIS